MNKSDFISAVSDKTEVTKTDIDRILTTSIEVITDTLKSGDSVSFNGFGTYKPVTKAARTARNPMTGETVKVAAKTVVKFKPSAKLSEAVNIPKKKKKKK